MPNFNKTLKTLRIEAGLSQQELADRTGISKSSINMYERGEREPGIETIKMLADHFCVSVDYLLGKSRPSKTIHQKTGEDPTNVWLTDEEVEQEIKRLNASHAVALARREVRLRYKRRQYLYQLRDLEKKGQALLAAGITREVLDALYKMQDADE